MTDFYPSSWLQPLTFSTCQVSSLTCVHSGQLWLPIDWWWWSLRRCDGCCSKGWPARATCPAWPPRPRLSWVALLVCHTLEIHSSKWNGIGLVRKSSSRHHHSSCSHIKLLYKNTTGLCARRKLKLKVKFNLLTKTLQSDNLPCDTTPPKWK